MKSATYHWFLWITNCATPILISLTLSIPFIAFGALGALRSTSNDPRQWLPKGFAETDAYDWFQGHFETDEAAVVSWTGCTLSEPRVEQLATALELTPFYDRVMTGPRVLRQLTNDSLAVPIRVALQRLQGVLIGEDRRTTCLLLITSEYAKANRSAAVATIYDLAKTTCQLEASELHLAGPTVDAAAIDLESRRLLTQLAAISALVSFCVGAFRLRSVRMASIVFVGAIYTTGLALATLYFAGGEMNLLMTMLPPLVYVLSISAAVHLVNYYREAVDQYPIVEAPARAAARGWLPCLLAALTTSIGLCSLAISQIGPIRMFGIYSAVGVMLSVFVLFVYLPSAFRLLSPHVRPKDARSEQRSELAISRIVLGLQKRHAVILTVCLAVLLAGSVGLLQIKSTVRLQARFLRSSPVLADYRWLEDHIGPMVPLEIVVRFRRESSLDLLQRLQLLQRIEQEIHRLPERIATFSAVDLVPPIPTGGGARQIIRQRVLNRRLEDEIASLINANYVAETTQEQLWRISVRANAISDLDYGLFAERLKRRVDPLLSDARATYTGVIPLIYKAQRQLLLDLIRSFGTAFAVIAIVMMIVLRSLSAALLTMVPNLFPVAVVFGGMGWAQTPVQIGSVMTASAALGIAVDDTVHFLTWFRRGLDSGMSRFAALRNSFAHCAGAMIHTTIICASGLLVFSASSFVPILHFAWLMVFLLIAALVGDLVLLPAILAGPFGKCFKRSRSDNERDVDSAADGSESTVKNRSAR